MSKLQTKLHDQEDKKSNDSDIILNLDLYILSFIKNELSCKNFNKWTIGKKDLRNFKNRTSVKALTLNMPPSKY